ncbi:unknown [Brachyspira sp. CAG:484]|nr:unknown [Brachyspira sp. CAG:484]
MQIQSQNPGKCQPNFQALRISSVTKGSRKIDIYSLTSKDKFFAEKMLNIAKGQKFSEDSKLLGAPSVRNVYDTALKKVKHLDTHPYDRVILSVEGGKKVTGVLNIGGQADSVVEGLAVWNNDRLTRDSLVVSALKDTSRSYGDFSALILPTASEPANTKAYFRRLGFKTPKDFGNKDLMVEGENLQTVIPKAQKAMNADETKDFTYRYYTDLAKMFDLDV